MPCEEIGYMLAYLICITGKSVGQLISEEKLDKGDIPWSTYNSYIKGAGGYIVCTLVISTFLLNVGSTAFSSWWLSMWLSAGSGVSTFLNLFQAYQAVYSFTILLLFFHK